MAACCLRVVQHRVQLGGLILTRRGYASRSLQLFHKLLATRLKADEDCFEALRGTLMKHPSGVEPSETACYAA
jgi:hypothetical protein